ncbi:hypothetical protein HMPREF1550_01019 [Actinomyces sp. oral taxon 877 str. F0543]|nr:hypothetical protein HMPREF1550_01019 [Actinomyces sp. oral taxon 877 str. F0543]
MRGKGTTGPPVGAPPGHRSPSGCARCCAPAHADTGGVSSPAERHFTGSVASPGPTASAGAVLEGEGLDLEGEGPVREIAFEVVQVLRAAQPRLRAPRVDGGVAPDDRQCRPPGASARGAHALLGPFRQCHGALLMVEPVAGGHGAPPTETPPYRRRGGAPIL